MPPHRLVIPTVGKTYHKVSDNRTHPIRATIWLVCFLSLKMSLWLMYYCLVLCNFTAAPPIKECVVTLHRPMSRHLNTNNLRLDFSACFQIAFVVLRHEPIGLQCNCNGGNCQHLLWIKCNTFMLNVFCNKVQYV